MVKKKDKPVYRYIKRKRLIPKSLLKKLKKNTIIF